MENLQNIKESLEKIIIAIKDNESIQKMVCDGKLKKPNVEELERASCNHIFTDYHKLFGIEEIDGAKIRDYIQEESGSKYEHVLFIRENFHEMLDNEDPRWIKQYVNPSRIENGLKPISPNYPN